MIGRRNGRKGFSLIELLISVGVLLIGILAVLVLFPLGLKESKTMVDESTAAIIARDARGLMETHPFLYNGHSKVGQGTASLIQATIGPTGTNNVFSSFPIMFPGKVLNGNTVPGFFDCISTNSANQSDITFSRIIDLAHPQYSWDARFTLGGGPGTDKPPVNLPGQAAGQQPDWESPSYWPIDPRTTQAHAPWPVGFNGIGQPTWANYYWSWFSQYFKYYAVQISVYRNYQQINVGSGTIWLKADKNYSSTDPNCPIYCDLVLTSPPDPNLTVDSYIRVLDDKSDWYRVTGVQVSGGTYTFRLDRPYWGLSLSGGSSQGWSRTSVIATNSLVESFTTILDSQLDDIDSSAITYP